MTDGVYVRHVVEIVQGLLVYDVAARDFYGDRLDRYECSTLGW